MLNVGFTSCESDKSKSEQYEVYSVVISEITNAPPPPLSWEKNGEKWNKYKDSISNVPISLGIINESTPLNRKIHLKESYQNDLVSKLNNSDSIINININELKLNERFSLTSINKKEISSFEDSKMDVMVFLSNVIFDKELNKAVVVRGISTSGKSGDTVLLILKKVNGKWVIASTKTLSIS